MHTRIPHWCITYRSEYTGRMQSPGGKFTRNMILGMELTTAGFIVVIALIAVASWYGYTRLNSLSSQLVELDAELASTTALLQGNIAEATSSLGSAIERQNQNVETQLGGVQEQVGSITGTVTDLQKSQPVLRHRQAVFVHF